MYCHFTLQLIFFKKPHFKISFAICRPFFPNFNVFQNEIFASCCQTLEKICRRGLLLLFVREKSMRAAEKIYRAQGSFCECAQPMRDDCNIVSHWLGAYTKSSLREWTCSCRYAMSQVTETSQNQILFFYSHLNSNKAVITNFAHHLTAVLPWYVYMCFVIWRPRMQL